MKKNIYHLIAIAALFFAGCSKTPTVQPNVPFPPSGTFSGHFILYHINPNTGVLASSDTCNLNLVMEAASSYKVTGDTTKLHAGSFGTYAVAQSLGEIQFTDKTYPASGVPTKVHLSGIYKYQSVGTSLQIVSYGPLDTLEYYYNLTKTAN